MKKFLAIPFVVVLLFLLSSPVTADQYFAVDLGTLGGATSSAYAVNSAGQIVGYADVGNNIPVPFLYQYGIMTALGNAEGSANDINDLGQVVGVSNGSAFLYQGGMLNNIGPATAASEATGINYWGDIVGVVGIDAARFGGGSWSSLGAGSFSVATAINDLGQISGYSEYVGSFVIDGGLDYFNTGYAEDISNTGQVVGSNGHGFSYSYDGTIINLGSPGPDWSEAYGNNNLGQIVGTFATESGEEHAALWQGNQALDLNDLLIDICQGWVLERAYDINDFGTIVGIGMNPAGQQHAFALYPTSSPPVPEPSSLLLLGLGLPFLARKINKM
ncbi:MAG: PEP-CTERM sorting domain-containing protein [Candidatus Paceibacterota bacterium]|jgi:probable HAF family extracellular repeat protein